MCLKSGRMGIQRIGEVSYKQLSILKSNQSLRTLNSYIFGGGEHIGYATICYLQCATIWEVTDDE